MSQPTASSQQSPSPENKNKTTKEENKKKIFSTKPVLPWEQEPHSVNVKSFVGYNIQFTGWTRKDILDKRRQQQLEEEEEEEEEAASSEPETAPVAHDD